MKNKQNLISTGAKGIAVLALISLLYSCTKDFTQINTNPNETTEASLQPSFLLSSAINRTILDPGMHERTTQLTNDVFAQYYANEGFSTQQGLTNDEWVTDYWNNYHYNILAGLNLAIKIGNTSTTRKYNETQISRIWRVFLCSRATDIFGDMPYDSASSGVYYNPNYTKQEDIYKDMFKELTEAEALLTTDNGPQPAGADYVYDDDITKWKKFAHSLRLRLALRVSLVDNGLAQSNAEAAVISGVFTGPDDACLVQRSVNYGWGNGYQYTYYYGWGAESMSRSMENLLTNLGGQAFPNPPADVNDDPGIDLLAADENTLDPNHNKFKVGAPSKVDPRGPVYFSVTSDASGAVSDVQLNVAADPSKATDAEKPHVNTLGRWRGVPAGIKPGSAGKAQYSVYNTTRLAPKFSSDTERPYEVMTYHEVCFLLAEAAFRGYAVGGTAEEWYNKGVLASMKWMGVDDATAAAYLANTTANVYGTTVPFTNTSIVEFGGETVNDQLSKIITQKYIALFPDGGWEAWADHRRTNRPVLIPFGSGLTDRYTKTPDLNPNNYTKRVTYPAIESLNNKAKYEAGALIQGPDLETTAVWWDVN